MAHAGVAAPGGSTDGVVAWTAKQTWQRHKTSFQCTGWQHTCELRACEHRTQHVAKLDAGHVCAKQGRTPMMLAYSIRISPPRNRKAIQFASGHSAQFACSVGQSFSCGNMIFFKHTLGNMHHMAEAGPQTASHAGAQSSCIAIVSINQLLQQSATPSLATNTLP